MDFCFVETQHAWIFFLIYSLFTARTRARDVYHYRYFHILLQQIIAALAIGAKLESSSPCGGEVGAGREPRILLHRMNKIPYDEISTWNLRGIPNI